MQINYGGGPAVNYGIVPGAAEENAQGEAMPVVVAQPPAGYAGNPADKLGNGTREHGALKRVAVGAASARDTLPALGASREIYVMSTVRCFFRTGDGTITAAAGTAHPLPADQRWYVQVPPGHTHIAFIRDGVTDGNMTVCAVA